MVMKLADTGPLRFSTISRRRRHVAARKRPLVACRAGESPLLAGVRVAASTLALGLGPCGMPPWLRIGIDGAIKPIMALRRAAACHQKWAWLAEPGLGIAA